MINNNQGLFFYKSKSLSLDLSITIKDHMWRSEGESLLWNGGGGVELVGTSFGGGGGYTWVLLLTEKSNFKHKFLQFLMQQNLQSTISISSTPSPPTLYFFLIENN